MNREIRKIAKWAQSQGWTVEDDASGHTRFYNPGGKYVTDYPATPSRPQRRMADLQVKLRKEGPASSAAEQKGTACQAPMLRTNETTTDRTMRRRTMSDWVMTFSYEGLDPTMAEMDGWTAQLEAFDGSVARIPSRSVVDVTVYAPGDFLMVDAVAKMAIEVGHVVMTEPTGVEIVREVEWQRRAEAPTMPELMSAAEIADELGVSRQRVHKLREMATFPLPLAELRGGAVWDAVAVRKFAENWKRKPGRPSANANAAPAGGRSPEAG